MTKFQKAFCVLLSLCFFAVLAMMPGPFFLKNNVYRQLPLYCFLEEEASSISQREDPETLARIVESNAAYLGEKVQAENTENAVRLENENSLENKNNTKDENGAQDADNLDSKMPADHMEEGTARKKEDKQAASSVPEYQAPEPTEITEPTIEPEPAEITEPTIEPEPAEMAAAQIQPHPVVDLSPEMLSDYDYLLGQFYILDPNTATNAEQLNAVDFLEEDLTMQQDSSKPQILIYHSHSQETFIDSREGEAEDTVVGVGNYLTQVLTENYGYNVIHVTETFDIIDGEVDRSKAYDVAREYIEQVLTENPSIEVVIDLHRDGVPEDRHLVTEINGKPTAQIMFYNGLSYTMDYGPVDYLPNPYIQDNLAFSFQLEYQAAQFYPDLYRGIYLAGLRYNLHLRPRALLLEAGAQTNTVQEVKNAMEPFADILNRVLSGA